MIALTVVWTKKGLKRNPTSCYSSDVYSGSTSLFVWSFTLCQEYSSYLMAIVHKYMFPGLFQPVLYQSIFLTLTGQSWCYSHNPESQGVKSLLPVPKDFGLSRPRIEPTTSLSQGGRSNH